MTTPAGARDGQSPDEHGVADLPGVRFYRMIVSAEDAMMASRAVRGSPATTRSRSGSRSVIEAERRVPTGQER
jgi:hypothetical protein